MKTLTKILLTQPIAYAVLLVIILSTIGYDYQILGCVLIIGIVLSWLNLIRKPSRMKTNYKVKKGKSYSLHRQTFHLWKKTMEGEFTLWESAEYPAHIKNVNQINKITGMSWGYHHNNSVRVGVVYNQMGYHDIYAYCYIDKYPVRTFMYKAKTGEKIKYKLGLKNGVMFIDLFNFKDEKIANFMNGKDVKPKIGYYLFPYHENATKDWTVELQFYR